MSTQVILGAALVATAIPVGWSAVAGARPEAGAALRRSGPPDARVRQLALPSRERLAGPAVARLASVARRVTPARVVDGVERRLATAGAQSGWTAERLLAAKLALGACGALLGLSRFLGSPGAMSLLFAWVVAYGLWRLPDFLLSQRADDRRDAIQRALPDTMDQLTIAVEAGLGFEAALAHVAGTGDGPLAEELRRTMQDIQLGVPRAEALDALAERADLPELARFLTALRQAGRHGLPIANVLRTQSAELRERRRQRAQEHAQKVPVKVLFPLILFIFPTLFIVVLGPGILRFVDAGGIGG